MHKRKIKALGFIMVLVLLSYILFHSLDGDIMLLLNDLENSPILYSLLNVGLLSLDAILPIPSSILMFLNGKVLGIFGGTILSLAGASLGNFIAYQIGFKSNHFINKGAQHKLSENLMSQFGIWAIMVTRAIPVLAEGMMIYAGLQKRKLKPIMMYSVLGYIPVCVVYAVLGSRMFQIKGFFIALAATTIFSCLILLLLYFRRRNTNDLVFLGDQND